MPTSPRTPDAESRDSRGVIDNTELSNEALLALSLAYLLSSLASAIAQTAAAIRASGDGAFTNGSLPFVGLVASVPLVAVVIRRRPTWLTLCGGLILMGIAVATLLVDANRFASDLSLTALSVGRQIVTATLLVVAWRSRSMVTGLLAGVFVLPMVLNDAVFRELFNVDNITDGDALIVVPLVLLSTALVASWVVRSGQQAPAPAEPPAAPELDDPGLEPTIILALTLALVGCAILARQSSPFQIGAGTGVALACVVAGYLIFAVARRNTENGTENGNGNQPRLDIAVLGFCAAATVLSAWTRFGGEILINGPGLLPVRLSPSFDNVAAWVRSVSFVLVATAVPLVALIVRTSRRLLALGAVAVAAAGLIWTFFVLADFSMGLPEYLFTTLLTEWGSILILGGTVAFALRSADRVSIEVALVFVSFLTVLEILGQELAFELIGFGLLSSGFQDTDDLQLFTVASAVGLLWIAAWWAFRPVRPAPSHDESHGLIDT